MENNDFLKEKAIKGTIWKFLERFLAQGISFIIAIILARILMPQDFTVVSIVSIFFAFANVIIAGGFNAALIQKKDTDNEDYSTVLYLSLVVSLGLYAILFFTAPLIARAYNQEILTVVIRVMSLVLPINSVKAVFCAYISSNLQFKKFFFATLGGTIVSGIVGITMALKGFGAWSLVVSNMTNAIIDTIILVFVAKLRIVICFNTKKIKALWGYGWKVFVSSLINTAYHQSRPLFIGLRFSSIDLSYYTKGSSIPNLISDTTTNTLSAVLFPVMSKNQDNKEKLLNWTRHFIRTTSFIAFPCMLGLFAVSDNLILVLLTEKWIEASFYLKVFSIAGMFTMINVGNCETIKGMGRSDIYLKMEIIKKTLYFITIGVFMLLSKDPHMLAISAFVTTLIAIAVNTVPNRKLINYYYKLQFYDIFINLVPATLMCVGVYFIGYIPLKITWLLLLIQIFSGIIIYFVLVIIFKNQSLHFIISIIKNIFDKIGWKKNK